MSSTLELSKNQKSPVSPVSVRGVAGAARAVGAGPGGADAEARPIEAQRDRVGDAGWWSDGRRKLVHAEGGRGVEPVVLAGERDPAGSGLRERKVVPGRSGVRAAPHAAHGQDAGDERGARVDRRGFGRIESEIRHVHAGQSPCRPRRSAVGARVDAAALKAARPGDAGAGGQSVAVRRVHAQRVQAGARSRRAARRRPGVARIRALEDVRRSVGVHRAARPRRQPRGLGERIRHRSPRRAVRRCWRGSSRRRRARSRWRRTGRKTARNTRESSGREPPEPAVFER